MLCKAPAEDAPWPDGGSCTEELRQKLMDVRLGYPQVIAGGACIQTHGPGWPGRNKNPQKCWLGNWMDFFPVNLSNI